MKEHLNWSFDYDFHQEGNCDYNQKLIELLSQGVTVRGETLRYAILPNFRFNHKNPKIMGQEEMRLGGLQMVFENDICVLDRYDATSGEAWQACYRTEAGGCVTGAVRLQKQAVTKGSAELFAEGGKYYLRSSALYYPVGVQCEEPLYNLYELGGHLDPENLPSGTISVFDESEMVYHGLHVHPIGQDYIRLNGDDVEIDGYCLTGSDLPPVYIWKKRMGRMLILSRPILTYVLEG